MSATTFRPWSAKPSEPFPYTTLSLNTACEKNLTLLRQAVEASEGGLVEEGGGITVRLQRPEPVRFEQSFEGLKPVSKTVLKKTLTKDILLTFVGNSIVVEGSVIKTGHDDSDYRAQVSAYIDDELASRFEAVRLYRPQVRDLLDLLPGKRKPHAPAGA